MAHSVVAALALILSSFLAQAGSESGKGVYLRVIVSQRSGRRVTTGLQKQDFEVTYRGRPQKIMYLSDLPGPVSLAAGFDFSESMVDHYPAQPYDAVKAFEALSAKADESILLAFSSRFFIMKQFDQDCLHFPPTGFPEAFEAAGGRRLTSVRDALLVLAETMEHSAHYGRRLIILLSDGEDTKSAYPIREVAARLESCGARLCFIVPWNRPGRMPFGFHVPWIRLGWMPVGIKEVLRATGGSYIIVPDFSRESLNAAMDWFFNEQNHEYVIGIPSPDEHRRVRRSDLKVKVRLGGRKVRFTISPLASELGPIDR